MTYQLTLVVKSSLKDTERKKLLDGLKDQIEGAKFNESEWGQKALAYPIKKEVSGFYINWLIDSDSVIPSDFERKLLTNDGVLRHLLLKQNAKGKTQSVKNKEAAALKTTAKKAKTKTKE